MRDALEAMGGSEAMERAGGLVLVGRGRFDLSARLQGRHPSKPDFVGLEEQLGIDLEGQRVAYETHARVNPDADEWIRYLYDDQGRMLIVLHLNEAAFWVPADRDHKRRYARISPHVLLQDALAQRHTLRHRGRIEGEEAVAFALPTGELVTLFFDPATELLRGFEYLLDLPLLGDTPIRWRFGDYRSVDGLGPHPTGYEIYLRDRLLKEVQYVSIQAGTEGAAVFEEPEGIAFPEPPSPIGHDAEQSDTAETGPGRELPEVRELADGVYLALQVRDGFHVLFVELKDFVVVVDAPAGYHELQMVPAIDWAGDVTSSSVGRRLLDAVRTTVPDKPVRYVVLTHHHGDHAGGVRPFIAAGATIVASDVTSSVVEAAAGATFRLQPDELTGRDLEPRIEIVRGERTISDGHRTVQVLDVGANPHAEGMLVVYLPQERILYQSDLFMPSGGNFPDLARLPVMKWFVEWLDASDIEPETIYSIHGSARVTAEQLAAIRSLD